MEKLTAHISTEIKASAEKVWKALTDPALIKKYFYGTEAISDWKPGSSIEFRGEWEGKPYHDKGVIKEIIPNKHLHYTYWSSRSGLEDKPENYVNIHYNLIDNGGICRLDISQDNIPGQEMKEHSEKSWRQVMNGMKELVENQASR